MRKNYYEPSSITIKKNSLFCQSMTKTDCQTIIVYYM